MLNEFQKSRRKFIKTSGLALSAGMVPSVTGFNSPTDASVRMASRASPQISNGLQFGDVLSDRAIVWSRCDRAGKMLIEYSFNPGFIDSRVIPGPKVSASSDYTASFDLTGLPQDQEVFVRIKFQDSNRPGASSQFCYGRFRTAPNHAKTIRFLWSGDTCGQGWGINPDIGGMKIFESMRQAGPDFFIHCGDSIYADCPIPAAQTVVETGEVWRNIVTPEVAKVAETLPEFRGRYKYNLLDHNLRRFNAEVPQIRLWDDHEITNNWSPSKSLDGDGRYSEKNLGKLVSYGTQAAMEYAPLRFDVAKSGIRIYRKIPYGPLLDIFVLDMRSYRGANNYNRQSYPGPETHYLGHEQLDWLKTGLKNSQAVWKVIAADMPIGLQLMDGLDRQKRQQFENTANGNGPVLGREFEIAELLAFVKHEKITNMVWFTADVHYCAAHFYDPEKARFKNFEPFWEFVSGPLNAGSFGLREFDDTFGPQLIFQKSSPIQNLSPLSGLQFFGQVDIDGESRIMTVTFKDINGAPLFSQDIRPVVSA